MSQQPQLGRTMRLRYRISSCVSALCSRGQLCNMYSQQLTMSYLVTHHVIRVIPAGFQHVPIELSSGQFKSWFRPWKKSPKVYIPRRWKLCIQRNRIRRESVKTGRLDPVRLGW